jgi:hypothetical protein
MSPCLLSSLPPELFELIFQHFNLCLFLPILSRVCRVFRSVVHSHPAWEYSQLKVRLQLTGPTPFLSCHHLLTALHTRGSVVCDEFSLFSPSVPTCSALRSPLQFIRSLNLQLWPHTSPTSLLHCFPLLEHVELRFYTFGHPGTIDDAASFLLVTAQLPLLTSFNYLGPLVPALKQFHHLDQFTLLASSTSQDFDINIIHSIMLGSHKLKRLQVPDSKIINNQYWNKFHKPSHDHERSINELVISGLIETEDDLSLLPTFCSLTSLSISISSVHFTRQDNPFNVIQSLTTLKHLNLNCYGLFYHHYSQLPELNQLKSLNIVGYFSSFHHWNWRVIHQLTQKTKYLDTFALNFLSYDKPQEDNIFFRRTDGLGLGSLAALLESHQNLNHIDIDWSEMLTEAAEAVPHQMIKLEIYCQRSWLTRWFNDNNRFRSPEMRKEFITILKGIDEDEQSLRSWRN